MGDGEVQTITLAELFAQLVSQRRREPAPCPAYLEEMERLSQMTLAEVRALWDEYDGMNSPQGFSDVAIHGELNRRGDGHYCAV